MLERGDTFALLSHPDVRRLVSRVSARGEGFEELAPLVKDRTLLGGRATAYLCRNRTCEAPTNDPEEILTQLGDPP